MNNIAKSEKRRIGDIGEDLACRFLVKRGFTVIDRNYLKKWGEIDIVVKKAGNIHFVEVKTAQREGVRDVIHETNLYRPEENVHPKKLQRMGRVIQSYLLEKQVENKEWQFDVLVVFLDLKEREARCRFTENVIL